MVKMVKKVMSQYYLLAVEEQVDLQNFYSYSE